MTIRIRTTTTTEAWKSLLFAHSKVNRRLEDDLRKRVGMNLGWYEVLLQLAMAPDQRLRMSEIADGMILSRSAATRLVDRLERHGLVERAVCDADRRGMEVSLTDIGRSRFVEAGRLHLRGIQEYFGNHCSPEELATLTTVLTRVAHAN